LPVAENVFCDTIKNQRERSWAHEENYSVVLALCACCCALMPAQRAAAVNDVCFVSLDDRLLDWEVRL
jgi:hypothetical protein